MVRAGSEVKEETYDPCQRSLWLAHTEGQGREIGSLLVCSTRCLTLCLLVLVPHSAMGERVCVRLVAITVKEEMLCICARVCCIYTAALFL